ncbi:MAG TPA: protein kinase [Gemmatimonadaceae bacterium]|nr:protein kinase [Gemmatimonadaceae bacterium]
MTSPDQPSASSASMSPERWARVRALVDEATSVTPAERAARIAASCGGDEVLAAQVGRLAADIDRAEGSWGFLAQSAGDLSAPLLAASDSPPPNAFAVGAEVPLRRGLTEMADVLARLRTALADRYVVERELATGGMATVYLARDVRHERPVAIKLLHPELSAMLGPDRFLSEIKTTASLHHPNILPLFDSGAADGLLFYVMPLVQGESLRARIEREKQLPVADAVRIVTQIADALEYAHRHGVVHRDIKPENILLHEGTPLVADFGIALAMQSAGAERMTRTGLSLGTPPYMSPEQASGSATIDGRSDVYSLACVLYELLVGDPPFTGSTPQIVIARVLGDLPSSVRTVRPSVPVHVEAAIARALAKLPADRPASAREFADSLAASITTIPNVSAGVLPTTRTSTVPWRISARLMVGAVVALALGIAAWIVSRRAATSAEMTPAVYSNLIDQTSQFARITITPNGRALIYTGIAEAGRPLMLRPLGQLESRVLRGTNGGGRPFVAPDGRRVAYVSRGGELTITTIEGFGDTEGSSGWRYGNGAWDGNDALIVEDETSRGLTRVAPGVGRRVALTRPDSTRGESRHDAPLVLPGSRAVVFTISRYGGKLHTVGPLAIASTTPAASSPSHRWLGIEARRAFAFIDGRLLYTSADGLAIMAVRLDVERRQVVGSPVVVWDVPAGDLQSASLTDNGTLLYLRRPTINALVRVDSTGAARPLLSGAKGSFMYPRLSPDGKRVAVQSTTADARFDVWTYDVATGSPNRLTTDGRALHPTWTPDGRRIVFMASERRGLKSQPADGSASAELVKGSEGAFAPDITPDGTAAVYQLLTAGIGYTMWSDRLDGRAAPRKVIDDGAPHSMPAVSPDGHWLADVSSVTGGNEVYVRPYPGPGAAVQVSDSGGVEPAWSPDGRHLYYRGQGAFMSARIRTPDLAVTSRRRLFTDTFDGGMPHRNYDVARDGLGFVMLSGGRADAVVVFDWLPTLRARLARAK